MEDDDCGELFITQEPLQSKNLAPELQENESEISESCQNLGGVDMMDFTSPCVSYMNDKVSMYEDISDSEDFVIPQSQKPNFE